jgi:hypothetical protein
MTSCATSSFSRRTELVVWFVGYSSVSYLLSSLFSWLVRQNFYFSVTLRRTVDSTHPSIPLFSESRDPYGSSEIRWPAISRVRRALHSHPLHNMMASSSSTIFTLAPMFMNERPLQNKFTRANMESC